MALVFASTMRCLQVARLALLLGLLASLCGCAAPVDPLDGLTPIGDDPSDHPIAGIDAAWNERFVAGDALFDEVFVEATGLGPLYIRTRCASCHAADGRGPGVVGKMAILGVDGEPRLMPAELPFGPTVRPLRAAGATLGIEPPRDVDGLYVVNRASPAVFARGYLEAIADSELERVEAAQSTRTDGISGRVHRVVYGSVSSADTTFHAHVRGERVFGRFGVKARIATLDDFVADAYQGDIGITSPLRPDELANPDALSDDASPGVDVDLETVARVADYLRLLAIPRRERTNGTSGEALFSRVGCDTCHVPTLRTRADYPIAQLADLDAPVYTDLLLHDMGAALSDGQRDGDAAPSEFRTAPLIGLRFFRSYLHDGRAPTVDDAIRFHGVDGSEASAAAARFEALSAADRVELVRFVTAL